MHVRDLGGNLVEVDGLDANTLDHSVLPEIKKLGDRRERSRRRCVMPG